MRYLAHFDQMEMSPHTGVATVHQRHHMHPIRTRLHEVVVQVIVADHPTRLKVTRDQCLVVSVGFIAAIIPNLSAVTCASCSRDEF